MNKIYEFNMAQRWQRFLVNSFADNPKTAWGKKELELELHKLWANFLCCELSVELEAKDEVR